MSINEERGNFFGVRVLELGQGVAAPYCGMLLAQNGATVTKIEPIGEGDWSRKLGQSYGEFSANAVVANWGKKSVSLDLKSEQGKAIVQKLAREADVIIENYRPGVTKRLGLDYGSVILHNKTVVYASLTGFGSVGPNKDLPGTDTVMQGYTGIMSINQDATGFPRRLDMLAVDVPAGLYLFQAVSSALYKRATQGVGSRISTSLLHCSLAFQQAKMIEFALTGSSSEILGAPIGTYRTADGFLSLNARRDPHFKSLCEVLDKDWMKDERFSTPESRTINREILTEYLTPIFARKTTREWCELFTEADILHAAVNNYGDLLKDPQVEAIGILNWENVTDMGRIPRIALPGLSGDDALKPAPKVGEHTDQVLKELGFLPEDIQRFRSAGVVG